MKPGKPTPPPSNDEIINALKIIKETCTKFGVLYDINCCRHCPLRTANDECGVFNTSYGDAICSPEEWEIIKPEAPYRILLN